MGVSGRRSLVEEQSPGAELATMATYVLLHGAGSDSTYWQFVAPRLRERGHEVLTPDLPVDDDSAGLAEYTAVVVDAIGDRAGPILVAQSMAGFTVPLVCERVSVALVVLVAAMVPATGESPGEWWSNTGQEAARRALDECEGRDPDAEFDPVATFLHDLPPELLETVLADGARRQSDTPFEQQLPMPAWPDVPTRFLLCRQDRFFPADFQRRVVRERLGIVPDEMDGGHLPALAHPEELTARLEAYRVGAGL
ncbi:Pimeloyl-ACP methyl ester carboxylesterase [Rhodococcus tukisamuensis]|uniref:Pimeloyl-ACP methyl ester carboxylesterase n=2 Tax=Rhodococcus tukisamuensis TaxID=168276 RepID=A0A1G6VJ82_9NOCA|nr:Pimeloyl-ACP methyl ester carboxylesterase [Rhodococcus tukisamuensis]